jgi:DNA replication protein DnaC
MTPPHLGFRDIVQHVVSRWHEIIGDMTLGDAILDRVVHRAHRLELKGASLRKRQTASIASLTDAAAQ